MPNYIVNGTDLTTIADAIRTKSGGTNSLSFPDGFVSECGNIKTVDTIQARTYTQRNTALNQGGTFSPGAGILHTVNISLTNPVPNTPVQITSMTVSTSDNSWDLTIKSITKPSETTAKIELWFSNISSNSVTIPAKYIYYSFVATYLSLSS